VKSGSADDCEGQGVVSKKSDEKKSVKKEGPNRRGGCIMEKHLREENK